MKPLDSTLGTRHRWQARDAFKRRRLLVCQFLFMAIFLAASLPSGRSANWYVDNAVTAGTNDGTSWATAWAAFSNVVWGASGVKAGDTLFISGGSTNKTYREKWTVGASGTATNPITITLDALNPAHNGVVIFDGSAEGDFGTGEFITCNRSFIVFDGNVGGSPHITFNNLRNISENSFNARAIFGNYTTNNVFRYLATTNCNEFIFQSPTTGIKIHNNICEGIRGIRCIGIIDSSGDWDANLIYSNYLGVVFNTNHPPGAVLPYYGPDTIQAGAGVSIFNNTFHMTKTTNFTSTSHPDHCQIGGNKIKIYNNEFINIGDSAVDRGLAGPSLEGFWIFNNIFRIEQTLDDFPEFIRVYNGNPGKVEDFKILNNTFVDNNVWLSIWIHNFGNPSGLGNEIKNNIFYNCIGDFGLPVILMDGSCNFTSNSFTFDGNVYYCATGVAYVHYGTTYPVSDWVRRFEPNGKTDSPDFVKYSPFSPTNDLQLSGADVIAVNSGVDLGESFAVDKCGVQRPQGAVWDIGAFESTLGGPAFTNLPAVISPITPSLLDADPSAPGCQVLTNTTVVYSALATDPNQDALTWAWLYSVNGQGEILALNGTGAVADAHFHYGPNLAGNSYEWILRVTDGFFSSESRFPLNVIAAPRNVSALTFEAELGVVTPPFAINDGCILQPVASSLTNSGRAAYGFVVTNTGDYMIKAIAAAPTYGQRSFYVNIDAEPAEPEMVWHVPITADFEEHLVSWQGSGTCSSPQFSPKAFHLTPGLHQLVVRGRDANVKLDQLAVVWILPEVHSLSPRSIQGSEVLAAGQVNPFGVATYAYFEHGRTTSYGSTTPLINVDPNGGLQPLEVMLTGLPPRTSYHYRLVAYAANGTNYGGDRTFTTGQPVLSAPTFQNGQFTVSVGTASNWVYFLQHKASLADLNWLTSTNVLGDGQVRILKDPLASAPIKFYRVAAFPLPEVRALPASPITENLATVKGLVDPLGIQTKAYFEFGATTNYGALSPVSDIAYNQSPTSVSHLMTGLSPATHYNFRLVAYNAFGTNQTPNRTLTTTGPSVSSASFQAGQFSVLISTITNRAYILEYKTNLLSPGWTMVSSNQGNGSFQSLLDPSAGDPQRFYRVRVAIP